MSEFDFIKAFVGFDILQAEAVAEAVGRVTAALFKGMTEAGMSGDDAHMVIRSALEAVASNLGPKS